MMSERLIPFVRGVSQIDHSDPDTLKDAFMNEVIENGGEYAVAPSVETCLYEISLHGIIARGASEVDAIRDWITAANAALANPAGEELEADGFITMHPPCGTPRNHAEEIRNAAAEATRIRSSYFNRLP